MCERKARCVTTTYLFLFFCFDSDEEWPISSTECWVVKLSYGHKVRSWKGLKVERKQRSESVGCKSESLGVNARRHSTQGEKHLKSWHGWKRNLTFHLLSNTWFHHPNPPCMWFYFDQFLYHSPVLSWILRSYFSLFPPIIHLGFCPLLPYFTPPLLSYHLFTIPPSFHLSLSDFLLSILPDGHN